MLILGRKEGEEILLGNDIKIKVVEVSKGVVKIGIDAPREVLVLRGELKDKIEGINKEANAKADVRVIKDLSKLLKK
jgi:carbon storage regulator